MANPYFNATYYLANNPDLFAAGVTVATAWDHYVSYGAQEAYTAGGMTRAPNAWFDAQFYLLNNQDLIANGVTPETAFDHFTSFGMQELRSPNQQIANDPITDASLLAYVNANSDVAKALNVTIPATELTSAQQNAAVAQYYGYGFSESRPSAPTDFNPNPTPVGSTFTLTTGSDYADGSGSYRNGSNQPYDFKFTAANEVVTASTATFGNAAANIDSLIDVSNTDNDVLNVAVANDTVLGVAVQNIETININVNSNTAAAAAAATGTQITWGTLTGVKTINVAGTSAFGVDFTTAGAVTNIGNSGVTTIDATGLTTNVGIRVDSSTSTATAGMTIKGAFGADVITGGLGADTIDGGSGADRLFGGAGADTINGGAGNDFISGQNDNDILNGDAGNDLIDGGNGADEINGGAGTDIIVAGAGNDKVTGGAGNDSISLGTILGGLAVGDAATVIAQTNAGGDIIVGTKATTAAGNNTVVFADSLANNGVDQIVGFETASTAAGVAQSGKDVLDVSAFLGSAVTNYTEVLAAGPNNVTGSNVVVVTNGALNTANFTFGANSKVVIVDLLDVAAAATAENARVNFVTTDANGAVISNDVVATLVAVTGAGSDLTGFDATNFFGG